MKNSLDFRFEPLSPGWSSNVHLDENEISNKKSLGNQHLNQHVGIDWDSQVPLPTPWIWKSQEAVGRRLLRLPSSVEGAIAAPEEAEEPQASGAAGLGGGNSIRTRRCYRLPA